MQDVVDPGVIPAVSTGARPFTWSGMNRGHESWYAASGGNAPGQPPEPHDPHAKFPLHPAERLGI